MNFIIYYYYFCLFCMYNKFGKFITILIINLMAAIIDYISCFFKLFKQKVLFLKNVASGVKTEHARFIEIPYFF